MLFVFIATFNILTKRLFCLIRQKFILTYQAQDTVVKPQGIKPPGIKTLVVKPPNESSLVLIAAKIFAPKCPWIIMSDHILESGHFCALSVAKVSRHGLKGRIMNSNIQTTDLTNALYVTRPSLDILGFTSTKKFTTVINSISAMYALTRPVVQQLFNFTFVFTLMKSLMLVSCATKNTSHHGI